MPGRLAAVAAEVAGENSARPVHSADLHLTLQFLGKVDAAQSAALRAACARLRAPAFELLLHGLEFWRSSRTLVLIAPNPPDLAVSLVTALVAQSAALGIAAPDHAWRPHVTLARVFGGETAQTARKLAEPLRWDVRGFCLAESRDEGAPGQPRYRILERWSTN